MRTTARQTRANRTIPVAFQNEAASLQLRGDGHACVEGVRALRLALGLPLQQKAPWRGGGCRTRHAHDGRVRLGRLTLWRVQCTTWRAVCTGLPPCVLRDRQMRPAVAREARLATPGGLRWERGAVLSPSAPLALSRLGCACGHHRLVTVLTRWGLPLPA